LSKRLERNGDESDQNQSLLLYKTIEERELPETVRSVVLGNHVSLLLHLFELREDARFLDTVLTLAEEAASTAEAGIPNLPWALLQVSKSALSRYHQLDEADLLRRSISAAEKAMDLAPDNHPDLAGIRTQLAVALAQAGDIPGNRDRARDLHLAAAAQESAPLADRISAAEMWGRDAAQNGEWTEARQAYSAAIGLLPGLAWRGADRSTQEYRILSAQGLAIDGAATALSDGDASDALALLEQGRTLIWRGSLEIWADLAALTVRAPGLAAQLGRVRAALNQEAVIAEA
jgi:hypothetical protein